MFAPDPSAADVVTTSTAMKSGLKEIAGKFSALNGLVTTSTAMKSGLKALTEAQGRYFRNGNNLYRDEKRTERRV